MRVDHLLDEPFVVSPRVPSPALEVTGLSARYGSLQVLDGIDLRVEAGATTAVVGPNGSGKTTLLDCVSGLNRYAGTVWLNGFDVTRLRPHSRVATGLARTFQVPSLVDSLDVVTNIALGAHHWDGDPRSRAGVAQAMATVDLLDLHHLVQRAVATLTHAERRLVEIARALVTRPRLLMLDEPTAGFSHDEGLRLCARILAASWTALCSWSSTTCRW
jgi:branched-chain amino acid transport system ATP-binding protein